jgi:hypothetical protein
MISQRQPSQGSIRTGIHPVRDRNRHAPFQSRAMLIANLVEALQNARCCKRALYSVQENPLSRGSSIGKLTVLCKQQRHGRRPSCAYIIGTTGASLSIGFIYEHDVNQGVQSEVDCPINLQSNICYCYCRLNAPPTSIHPSITATISLPSSTSCSSRKSCQEPADSAFAKTGRTVAGACHKMLPTKFAMHNNVFQMHNCALYVLQQADRSCTIV